MSSLGPDTMAAGHSSCNPAGAAANVVGMARRTGSSVRFDPYWKVQWWEERSLAWRDVQHAYPSEAEALEHLVAGQRCRLMRVFPGGREPGPPLEP